MPKWIGLGDSTGLSMLSTVSWSRRPSVLGSFFEHQPDLLGRLTARGLLHECVLQRPLPLHCINLLETRFHHPSTRPPFGQHRDLP
jgi:hypothetical protein